jgi:hypothetical protein
VAEFGGRWGTYDTAPDLELVVLRRDGSGFLEFRSGERRSFTEAAHPFRVNPFLRKSDDVAQVRDPFFDFDYWLELDDWCAEKYWRNRAEQVKVSDEVAAEKEELVNE